MNWYEKAKLLDEANAQLPWPPDRGPSPVIAAREACGITNADYALQRFLRPLWILRESGFTEDQLAELTGEEAYRLCRRFR